MKMRVLLSVVVLAAVSGMLISQTNSQESKPAPGTMTPSQEEMMATYMKYAQPGDHHKALEPMIGNWEAISRFWPDPSAPPETSLATCESHWILGGRFMQEDVSGVINGMPFHGIGITGYDNFKQQYNYVWMDEMATSLMLASGTADQTGKIITFKGTYDDPATGAKDQPFRAVTRIASNDQHTYEMYALGKDGKEFKTFDVGYTRKK
jgi:hypothetical protein